MHEGRVAEMPVPTAVLEDGQSATSQHHAEAASTTPSQGTIRPGAGLCDALLGVALGLGVVALLFLSSPRAVVAGGDWRESPGPSGAEVLWWLSVFSAEASPRCEAAAGGSEGGSPRSLGEVPGAPLQLPCHFYLFFEKTRTNVSTWTGRVHPRLPQGGARP